MQSKLTEIRVRVSQGYFELPYRRNWLFPYQSAARHVVEFTVVCAHFIRLPYTFFGHFTTRD